MPGPASAVPNGNVQNLLMVAVANTVTSNVNANTTTELSYTVPGLRVGDVVTVIKPSFQAGLTIPSARVSAPNTLTVLFLNNTGSAIARVAETYTVLVARSSCDSQAQLPTGIA